LIREVLEAAGIQSGLLGTVLQIVGGVEEEVERTTPEAIDLQATFRRMLEAGDRACAMEVSSHALALHRADSIHFELALFTNLTQDHLDFHGDMEEYFRSKRLLFEMGPRASIVNADDPYGMRLAGEFDTATFSATGAAADFTATNVSFDATSASFTANHPPTGLERVDMSRSRPVGGWVEVRTGLPGGFMWLMRSGRSRRLLRSGSRRTWRPTGSVGPSGCRGGSSRLTRDRASPCWSTTPTHRTRWRTCCGRRGG
jgi:UDP-N-acetylmuramyl tripeptide synthase